MQISMFPKNSTNLTVGGAAHAKQVSARTSGCVFSGAQCKVTISKEGKKLSDQAQTQTTRSAQSLKAEKIMLRQQEETAQIGSIRDEYKDQLKELDEEMVSLNRSYPSGGDDIAALRKRQVLEAMRKQIQTQLEENRRKQDDAQQMAKQSFGTQDEIDQKNRDLLIMLKSIEESEKAEEEAKNGGGEAENGTNGGARTKNSVSDVIQNAAAEFGASSAKRELGVVDMIDGLNAEGHFYLDKATEITSGILKDSQSLRELLDDERYTDDEKTEAMLRHQMKVTSAYQEVYWDRRRGLKMIRDARECKLQHIADNPLQGVDETKERMMLSATEAAINEASKSKLDEASQELQDEVEKLIDERNDVAHTKSDDKGNNDEQKEISDLFGTEDAELKKE